MCDASTVLTSVTMCLVQDSLQGLFQVTGVHWYRTSVSCSLTHRMTTLRPRRASMSREQNAEARLSHRPTKMHTKVSHNISPRRKHTHTHTRIQRHTRTHIYTHTGTGTGAHTSTHTGTDTVRGTRTNTCTQQSHKHSHNLAPRHPQVARRLNTIVVTSVGSRFLLLCC